MATFQRVLYKKNAVSPGATDRGLYGKSVRNSADENCIIIVFVHTPLSKPFRFQDFIRNNIGVDGFTTSIKIISLNHVSSVSFCISLEPLKSQRD